MYFKSFIFNEGLLGMLSTSLDNVSVLLKYKFLNSLSATCLCGGTG